MSAILTRLARFALLLVSLQNCMARDNDLTTRISAQVIDIEAGELHTAILFDMTNGLPVFFDPGFLCRIKTGDMIDAELIRNTHNDLQLTSFQSLGGAPLPMPLETDLAHLPKYLYQPVSIRGVVRSAQRDITNNAWVWMTLRTTDGDLPIAAQEQQFPLAELRQLIDAEVKFTGYAKPMCTWRTGLGHCLCLIPGYRQETIIPPKDFDSTPPFAKNLLPHRQRISGTVIAMAHERLFVSIDGDCCLEVYPSEMSAVRAARGDSVTLAGFFDPSVEDYIVTEAILRIDEKSRIADFTATEISFEDLFKNIRGNDIISTRFSRRMIRITSAVKGLYDSPDGRNFIILGNEKHTLNVDISALDAEKLPSIRIGCIVEAIGLCLADFSPPSARARPFAFSSFTLLPTRAKDLHVIRNPPAPSSQLLLTIIGVLVMALIGITLWNRSISALAEKRGELLSREKIAAAEARLKIGERTRLAVELHDALSQNLTGVSLQLDAVHRFADDKKKQSRHLAIAMLTLKSCRNELRNCLWDLRNHALEEPDMNAAIRRIISPFIGDAKLVIRFNVPRERLSDDTAHALMRILRELATNAVKHGHAATIRIAGALENGQLLFSVSDDGDGFDPQNRPSVNDGHFGLEGIRERISRLHGHMELKSILHKGTIVTISLTA